MSALTTRDALAKALEEAVSDLNNRGVISDGYGWEEIADALLASGAVIDAATLVNDKAVWERVCAAVAPVLDRNLPGWDAGQTTTAALRALAAALTERGQA